jgi:hypothetical protein
MFNRSSWIAIWYRYSATSNSQIDFFEKKNPSLCPLSNIVARAITFFPFNLFFSGYILVLRSAYCFFNYFAYLKSNNFFLIGWFGVLFLVFSRFLKIPSASKSSAFWLILGELVFFLFFKLIFYRSNFFFLNFKTQKHILSKFCIDLYRL